MFARVAGMSLVVTAALEHRANEETGSVFVSTSLSDRSVTT